MSREEAENYFENFVHVAPERIREIQRQLYLTRSDVVLDLSIESVAQLGSWFDAHVEPRSLTTEELLEQHSKAPDWIREWIPTDTLSSRTISFCMDIGIYFGETLRHHHPQLKWALPSLPTNDLSFQQPVLVPFKNVYLNPFIIMINVAGKVLSGISAAEEMPKLLQIWSSLVKT